MFPKLYQTPANASGNQSGEHERRQVAGGYKPGLAGFLNILYGSEAQVFNLYQLT